MVETKERATDRSSLARITVELEPGLKRDIKAEASRRGESIREYVVAILSEGHEQRKQNDK